MFCCFDVYSFGMEKRQNKSKISKMGLKIIEIQADLKSLI